MSNFLKFNQTPNQKWFFTSDLHLNHTRIIQFCDRPFSDVVQMNNSLIDGINLKVRKSDVLVIAGDFCWSDPRPFLERINCENLILVRGSHDPLFKNILKIPRIRVFDELQMILDGQSIVVSHTPHLVWEKSHYGSWNLFGHIHSKGDFPRYDPPSLIDMVIQHGKMLDIGVDGHNFLPWSLEEIREKIDKKPGFLLQNSQQKVN